MRPLSPSFWELTGAPGPELPVALVFPFAGGSAHSVREWGERLPGFRTIAVQYPGHGGRTGEPFAESVEELAATLVKEYLAEFTEPPRLLLGHSMGSLVALEAALVLEQHGTPADVLVVSAAGPPGTRAGGDGPLSENSHGSPLHLLDDEVLAASLVAAGGLPAETLNEPELLALALPVVRHDFRLGWDYASPSAGRTVSCPLVAVGGAADAAVPAEVLRAWAPLTTGTFTTRTWPGGHFYYREELPGLDALVRPARLRPAQSPAGDALSAPGAESAPVEPMESEVLRAVIEVWGELLPATEVNGQTRFFEAGGTSIAAMRGCAKLSSRLGVRVPVKILLNHGRLDEFAVQVSEIRRAAR
ncbi:alpha/beta fold hydrolase [Streptomyces graminilatus]|uniref:alpha/beta fold hydrolase n=1 Tax=Streptomyces graminilatus TaxID=1464070 RepID=UPI0006E40FB2|nr:alpha/beta fold hydrolase [Streptomyces graminilatus]